MNIPIELLGLRSESFPHAQGRYGSRFKGYPLKRIYIKKTENDKWLVMLPMINKKGKYFKFVRLKKLKKVLIYTDNWVEVDTWDEVESIKYYHYSKYKPMQFYLYDVIEKELAFFGKHGNLLKTNTVK